MPEEEKDCPIQHENCPYFNPNLIQKESWWAKNWAMSCIIGISVLGWVYTGGSYTYRINMIENRMLEVDRLGSQVAQQAAFKLDIETKRIERLEEDMKKANSDIIEIKADVRLTAEWVREQKQKQLNK